MNNNYQGLFSNLTEVAPTKGLKVLIMRRIEIETKKRLFRQLIVDSAVLVFSTGLTTVFTIWAWISINTTAFKDLLSLAYSDLPVVINNWQVFMYAILETLPATLSFLLVASLFVTLWFGRDLYIKKFQLLRY